MKGKITKGIAGFYYVWCEDHNLYECKAKGIFRNEGIKPLVGDDVVICVLDEEHRLGSIEEILPRTNELIRPAVANVDQAMVVFAMKDPVPNLNLLDRFLIMMQWQHVDTILCFTKQDIVSPSVERSYHQIYDPCVSKVLTVSNTRGMGITAVRECLEGKTTVLAGPSGVGKSSLLNSLDPMAGSATGEISEKIGRGKHTTRHSEIYYLGDHTFLLDTPGFSSLRPPDIDKDQLSHLFTEFEPYDGQCRYLGCSHTHEPGCVVKDALERGLINKSRYDNYVQIYNELSELTGQNKWRSRK